MEERRGEEGRPGRTVARPHRSQIFSSLATQVRDLIAPHLGTRAGNCDAHFWGVNPTRRQRFTVFTNFRFTPHLGTRAGNCDAHFWGVDPTRRQRFTNFRFTPHLGTNLILSLGHGPSGIFIGPVKRSWGPPQNRARLSLSSVVSKQKTPIKMPISKKFSRSREAFGCAPR